MSKVYFLFGIHNHQPVGNDSFVFNKNFEDCYRPFLDVLKEFPEIKCNIHTSGPLYDWILTHHYEYIEILREMSQKGQIEVTGGAYYEPILSIISDKDKFAQIKFMNDFIKKEIGKAPSGMWLAERVWEPQLASVINESNLKYTFLDDVHFRSAGINDKELTGYYTTENNAKSIAVFPINKALRFKIPFSQVEESIALIKSFSQKKDVLITLFDDGEKFGSWPWTYDWIYKKKWLKKFFSSLLENKKEIETITASEALKKFKTNGLVYLPTSSYPEMDEWTMESQDFLYYKEVKDRLKKYPDYRKLRNYLRAGFFRNFFIKYPRANYMHKKMLYLSENIHKKIKTQKHFISAEDKNILNYLYKAQCNCGYWHGLFGGFYLGNIRTAIYENLIKAEKEFDDKYENKKIIVQKADFDFDGFSEITVKNNQIISTFSDKGGTLLELGYKKINFNFLNTITRKEEPYHNNKKTKKGKIIKKQEIIYDKYERVSLVDHLLSKNIILGDFEKQQKFQTLSNKLYKSNIIQKENSALLEYCYNDENLEFKKSIKIKQDSEIKVNYNFKNDNLLKKQIFATEFNIFFESVGDVRIFLENNKIDLKRKRVFKNINKLKIIDNFKKAELQFDFSSANIFIIPIYSYANSQDGVEKVFQEVSILFIKRQSEKKFDLKVKITNK